MLPTLVLLASNYRWMIFNSHLDVFTAAALRGVALTRATLAARQAAQLSGLYGRQNAAALAVAGLRPTAMPQGLPYATAALP